MNKSTSIIIIVCAYNEEDNIENCLKSVRHSILESGSKSRFKLICVDNSSKDKTWDIVNNFPSNGIDFTPLRIEHCELCVSRNIYKFFSGFEYVAYIDGDGGMDENWCRELLKNIDSNNLDIISGPVLPICNHGKSNALWEVFYDASLHKNSRYIIGANMCYSISFLEKINGFPKVFDTRGDETCLLLKAKLLGFNNKSVFLKDLISFNHFSNKRYDFLIEQFFDGDRSAKINRLWVNKYKAIASLIFRMVRVLSFFCSLLFIPISPDVAAVCFVLHLSITIANMPNFFLQVLKKIISRSNSSNFIDGVIIIFSFIIFDIGFIKGYMSKIKISKNKIFTSSKPNLISSHD